MFKLKGNAMTNRHRSSSTSPTVLFLALALGAGAGAAQQVPAAPSPLKRTQVFRDDVSASNHEAVIVKAELAGHGHAGRHTHPGDEITYVVDGEGDLMVEGLPTRHLKAGDGFVVREGKVHDLQNTGARPMHLLGTYVVEKGKPLATPAK
jgi:quercetin dioxygenase-like cupin family protein